MDLNNDIFAIQDNFKVHSAVKSISIKASEIEAPKVTIFVPTYKRTFTLSETLNSILALEGKFQYEILLLDNNPERDDETELLIRKQYNNVPQLSYYKNSENIGMTGNWNRGYELARGEWVVMLHDDDCLFHDSMYKALYIINMLGNELDALFLNHVFDNKYCHKNNIGHIKKLCLYDFFMNNCGTVVGALMKKTSVLSLGGFSDDLYPAADYHFWAKITKYKIAYRVLDIPCAFYRIGVNTSCNPAIITKMIESASKVQYGVLYNEFNNSIIRFIGNYKIKYWSYKYLYAWKNIFGNNQNIEEVNRLIDVGKKNIGIMTRIIGRFFDYVYCIYNKCRNIIEIHY